MNSNKYIINVDEINKLKRDLMKGKSSKTKTTSDNSNKDNKSNKNDKDFIISIVSEEMKKKINTQTGPVFEDNIRGLLKYSFNFKEYSIPRKIFYRTIEIENETIKRFSLHYSQSKIPINGKEYKFILNQDFSISIIDNQTNDLITSVAIVKVNKIINDKELTFSNHNEIEVDGILN